MAEPLCEVYQHQCFRSHLCTNTLFGAGLPGVSFQKPEELARMIIKGENENRIEKNKQKS
jgi:hypothetical protein